MKGLSRLLDMDIILMFVLGAFAAIFFVDTFNYNPTAALFPRVISIFSILCVVWTILRRIVTLSRSSPGTSEPAEARKEDTMRWYTSAGTMVAYFILIHILGYTLTTLLYLVAIPVLLGYRKYKIIFLVGILWTVSFVAVFGYFLHTRIPGGLLGDFIHRLTHG